ncbi:putative N-acetyltransferase 8B [Galemys pyrenaicus]|uniref:Putative N-acetyltransferase 8B n=1 Tax=Galemys pyrenaicus TaxID=202257 RepID=A0A8J6DS36_GALPY|nr:putative N-acetyltransferase 8B [Galemys pyrenaicus]
MAPLPPYHIRKYQSRDRQWILSLYSTSVAEYVPTTFYHTLKLPRMILLLLGVPFAVFLVTGSWLLALLANISLLTALWFLVRYEWIKFVDMSLRTDMSDITKSYFSEHGSCFWVAECEGQVVAMVGALPAKDPVLRKEQLELLHLCVALRHRGRGIAKALVRTVLQFGQDQGYGAVILSTSMMQHSALALYQHMGFQKTRQYYNSFWYRAFDVSVIRFIYHLPPAQVSKEVKQAGGLLTRQQVTGQTLSCQVDLYRGVAPQWRPASPVHLERLCELELTSEDFYKSIMTQLRLLQQSPNASIWTTGPVGQGSATLTILPLQRSCHCPKGPAFPCLRHFTPLVLSLNPPAPRSALPRLPPLWSLPHIPQSLTSHSLEHKPRSPQHLVPHRHTSFHTGARFLPQRAMRNRGLLDRCAGTPGTTRGLRLNTKPSMAPLPPYHIRKYQSRDRQWILSLYSTSVAEYVPTTFYHTLKLPRMILLLLGVPFAVFLVTGSWLLALLANISLLTALWFLVRYEWIKFVDMSLRTDMSDITKSYFSEHGSCFWVAECEGQVVAMVGALPAKDPVLRKEQLELLHLCVALRHRGRGIAKALVRTVLQFGQDQGYGAVILSTSMMQHSALALYQHMGFQKTRQYYNSFWYRAFDVSVIRFIYHLPPAQVSKEVKQAGGL